MTTPIQTTVPANRGRNFRRARSGSLRRPVEVFNLFNHLNFTNTGSDVSTPATFVKVSAQSVDPRIMQYELKFEF